MRAFSAPAAPRRPSSFSASSEPIAGRPSSTASPCGIATPRDAARLRFGFTPEDRKTEGIVAELSIRENIILALQAQRGWLHLLPKRRQDEIADRFIKLLDIRTPDAEKPIGLLSGGNQQKALLARWLATEPRFLILDEPTRGIDVGAHAEIIRLIERLCEDGLALLVISSELEEIASYSDRVVVLRDRQARARALRRRGQCRYHHDNHREAIE